MTNYFDALEVNDNDVRYLRTAWVVNVFGNYTIRSRLIFRLTDENPLEYRFKLVSEREQEAKHHLEKMKNLNLGTEF